MTHIVVIGSGFGGCTSVRALRKQGFQKSITLISPAPHLFYYPSLIWVPAGRRQESDLRVGLESFFRRNSVTHHSASVNGLDPKQKKIFTDNGELNYDYVIIASGGRYIRKLPGIEHAHVTCAGWEPTKSYSDKLNAMDGGSLAFGFASNPKEPAAMRGGPIFEYLFGIETQLRKQHKRDRFRLTFFTPAPRPGARMGEKAVDRLLREMARRGIHTHLGNKLKAIEADKVITEGGEVTSDLTMFIPGMTGPSWASESGLSLSEGGFLLADEYCKSPGVEAVYIVGDAGSFPGPEWKPKQAHLADLQAKTAVRNLLASMNGQPETHTFKTELICIIDSLTTGTLVYRDSRRSFQLTGPPLHWAKSLFEWNYLRPYRNLA